VSQDCDRPTTVPRHPLNTVMDMKKTLATLALSTLLVATLSGCAFELRDPSVGSSNGPNEPTEQVETETPDGESGGLIGSGACDDRDIVVDQEGARLVLTGNCASVTVTADDVAVNIETADSVTVSGSEVSVIATEVGTVEVTGDNVTINPDRVESIEIAGQYVTLITKYAGAVTVSGDFNVANWDDGAASAKDTGTGNTLVGP